ncbi:MAG: ribonuclease [Microbacteriaceae bacterium]|jgi:ribonuclease HI|nr:ribonuclease [Microbacteriaceae bacterium]
MVRLFTDGSSSGAKGGAGGFAALLIHDQSERELIVQGGEPDTTNQRMELTAVIEGLVHLKRAAEVTIYTDSAYVMNCFIQGWHRKWAKNGWLNKDEEPVANKDLWLAALAAIEPHTVTWVKLKGHVKLPCTHDGCMCSGDETLHALNARADQLAVQAKQAIKDHGTVAGLLLEEAA